MATRLQSNQAKCASIVEFVKNEIESGQLQPGDRLPTVAALKTKFGVSNFTISQSYYLLEQEGLVRRLQGSGVFVADVAPVAMQGVLGIIVPAQLRRHPYYERIMRGVGQVALDESIELLLLHESSNIRWEKVDGVLLVTPPYIYDCDRLPPGMPAVSLLHRHQRMPSVVTDDGPAMEDIVEHLVALGHRRIAIMSGAPSLRHAEADLPASVDRLAGYYKAMRAAGIEPRKEWVRQLFTIEATVELVDDRIVGRRAMQRWLDDDWRSLDCTALIYQNDGTAVGAIELLQEVGIKTPEHLSVVGFDGIEIAEYFRPRLTTVEVPLEEIGARGARLLLEQIRLPLSSNPEANQIPEDKVTTVVLPSRLKIGDSTAAPAVANASI